MYWKKVNEETNESEVIVKTLNGVKESFCPKCGLPLLKRPFDAAMKANGNYKTQRYDYHCAVCNQAYDRFTIDVN